MFAVRRSCPYLLFLVWASEFIRFPSGPNALFSSAWYLSGAEIDEEGEPEAEVFAVSIPLSTVELRLSPPAFLDLLLDGKPEVIRTRGRKRTLGRECLTATVGA